MNAPPMIGPKTAIRSRWCPPTLWMATASGTAQATAPATASAARARRRLGEGADRATEEVRPRAAASSRDGHAVDRARRRAAAARQRAGRRRRRVRALRRPGAGPRRVPRAAGAAAADARLELAAIDWLAPHADLSEDLRASPPVRDSRGGGPRRRGRLGSLPRLSRGRRPGRGAPCRGEGARRDVRGQLGRRGLRPVRRRVRARRLRVRRRAAVRRRGRRRLGELGARRRCAVQARGGVGGRRA